MLKSCTSCGHLPPKPWPCELVNGGPCGPCHVLESFDKEAQAILKRLSEKHLEKINKRHDPFIHHLPIELVSQIFISCLPDQALDQDACRISLLWDPLDCRCIQPFNIVLGAISQAGVGSHGRHPDCGRYCQFVCLALIAKLTRIWCWNGFDDLATPR